MEIKTPTINTNYYPISIYQDKEIQLKNLLDKIHEYNSDEKDIELIKKAFELSYEKHKDQKRESGEPYFNHPYSVSFILTQLNADTEMIVATLLHSILEKTDYTPEQMQEEFGVGVFKLVNGVTTLSKFSFSSKEERKAENFRRMFLVMAKDIRVIIIKLADRLDNMRNLHYLPEEKQIEISKETLEIFAPLAHRLGIARIKWELEDMCLKYLDPKAYWNIKKSVAGKRIEREEYINKVIDKLKTELSLFDIKAEITGRPKHFYSIYEKMQRKHKEISELYDILAIRIIVETEKDCYEVLGIVHNLWKHIPEFYSDYIVNPKPNGYQSIHTKVIGPENRTLEVQIRTHKMHYVADFGVAAHWIYKGKGSKIISPDLQAVWLKQLLEWQKDLKISEKFNENNKENDLFNDEVFVFSPQGEVYNLKLGATPIDFAYSVHTQIGNKCTGAKINGKMVPLNTKLKNGDTVEIITSKTGQPSRDWLNIVVTNLAKNQIRRWFKKERREENIKLGKEILNSEIERRKLSVKSVELEKILKEISEKLHHPSIEDLFAEIGYGGIGTGHIINRLILFKKEQREQEIRLGQEKLNLEFERLGLKITLFDLEEKTLKEICQSLGYSSIDDLFVKIGSEKITPKELNQILSKFSNIRPENQVIKKTKIIGDILVDGTSGLEVHLAQCCSPIYGEKIIGVIKKAKGILIHKSDCLNLKRVNKDRFIFVEWPEESKTSYKVELEIEAIDKQGLLKDILAKVSDNKTNLIGVNAVGVKGKTAKINLLVEIDSINHLENLIKILTQMSDVQSVKRLKHFSGNIKGIKDTPEKKKIKTSKK